MTLPANVERFSGFAAGYDAYRPRPPEVVAETVCRFAGIERPQRVVDLGCGTGLSTWIWADRADEVLGIEPNPDMRRYAEVGLAARKDVRNVRFGNGLANRTGLPDASVDIMTCCQSFHWMDPEPTLAEAARVLRTGGVFVAYHPEYPPTVHWELDAAYTAFIERARALERELGASPGVVKWDKRRQLDWIAGSGHFRFAREVALHSEETGDAERYVQQAISHSPVQAVLRAGVTEEEIGLDALARVARLRLADAPAVWTYSWLLRAGVK